MLTKGTQIVVLAIVCAVLMTEASNHDLIARGRLMGGWNKLSVTDSEVQSLATEAAAHLETVRNTGKVYQVQDVISAKYQVVRGKNIMLALRIGETDCLREPNVDIEDCTIVKRPMVGREEKIDVDSDEVRQVAAFAAAELTSQSNGLYEVQHRCISRATTQPKLCVSKRVYINGGATRCIILTQDSTLIHRGGHLQVDCPTTEIPKRSVFTVVAGALYRVTMDVSVTAGKKSKTARCTVKVSDQAWMTPRYTLVEYKCNRLIS